MNKNFNWRGFLSDVLLLCGGAAISLGVGLFDMKAGIIVGGVLAIAYGLLIGFGGDTE